MTTPQLILNLVLFQAAWWLCILSGAWGVPLVALPLVYGFSRSLDNPVPSLPVAS